MAEIEAILKDADVSGNNGLDKLCYIRLRLINCEYPKKWTVSHEFFRLNPGNDDKFCHYTWEKYLYPFLWRIMLGFEAVENNEVLACARNLSLAEKILEAGILGNDRTCIKFQESMKHILFATVAHILIQRELYNDAVKCMQKIKVFQELKVHEKAALFGMKAIILSRHAENGKVHALDCIVKCLRLTPQEPEWRLVFIELIFPLYNLNISAFKVREATMHMPYTIQPIHNGFMTNVNTLAKYFKDTWFQRNKPQALRNIISALSEITRTSVAAERLEELQLIVLEALEVDPFCGNILITAIQFFSFFDPHKALLLSELGKEMYRDCAEMWIEMRHLLHPLDNLYIHQVLRYYSPEWNIPILKRAAVYYLDMMPRQAYHDAIRILQAESQMWLNRELLESYEEPLLFIWGKLAGEGFYKVVACFAYFAQNDPNAGAYLQNYSSVFGSLQKFDIRPEEAMNVVQRVNSIFNENIFFKIPFSESLYDAPSNLVL